MQWPKPWLRESWILFAQTPPSPFGFCVVKMACVSVCLCVENRIINISLKFTCKVSVPCICRAVLYFHAIKWVFIACVLEKLMIKDGVTYTLTYNLQITFCFMFCFLCVPVKICHTDFMRLSHCEWFLEGRTAAFVGCACRLTCPLSPSTEHPRRSHVVFRSLPFSPWLFSYQWTCVGLSPVGLFNDSCVLPWICTLFKAHM